MSENKRGRGRRKPWITIAVEADFTIGRRQIIRAAKIVCGLLVATLPILLRGLGLLP